jgi:hypothetical protein
MDKLLTDEFSFSTGQCDKSHVPRDSDLKIL